MRVIRVNGDYIAVHFGKAEEYLIVQSIIHCINQYSDIYQETVSLHNKLSYHRQALNFSTRVFFSGSLCKVSVTAARGYLHTESSRRYILCLLSGN